MKVLYRTVCLSLQCVVSVSLFHEMPITYSDAMCKYKLHLTQQTRNEALEKCRSLNLELAKVRNKTEVKMLTELASEYSVSDLWIGLYYDNNTSQFLWSDCNEAERDIWEFDEPNYAEAQCVKLDTAMEGLVAEFCDKNQYFVCQNYTQEINKCFKFRDEYPSQYKIKGSVQVDSPDECGKMCMEDPLCMGASLKHNMKCYMLYAATDPDGSSPNFSGYYQKDIVATSNVSKPNNDILPISCKRTGPTDTLQISSSTMNIVPTSALTGTLWFTLTGDATFQIDQYGTGFSMNLHMATSTVTAIPPPYILSVVPTKVLKTMISSALETKYISLGILSVSDSAVHTDAFIDVEERIRIIKEDLTVKRKELSSFKRRFISAKDSRPSATSIGVLGLVILMTVVLSIIALDLPNLIRGVNGFYRNMRKCRKRFKTFELKYSNYPENVNTD